MKKQRVPGVRGPVTRLVGAQQIAQGLGITVSKLERWRARDPSFPVKEVRGVLVTTADAIEAWARQHVRKEQAAKSVQRAQERRSGEERG